MKRDKGRLLDTIKAARRKAEDTGEPGELASNYREGQGKTKNTY